MVRSVYNIRIDAFGVAAGAQSHDDAVDRADRPTCPAEQLDRRPDPDGKRRQRLKLVLMVVQRQPDLTEVIQALRAPCRFPSGLDCWYRQCHQNASELPSKNDHDDAARWMPSEHHHPPPLPDTQSRL